jgi:hypothetical protein
VSYRPRKESEPLQLFVEEKNSQSFIKEHHLGQFMEFTIFVVGGKGRHLINLGDRRKGLHLPTNQYCKNLKKRPTERPTFRVSYQQRVLRNSVSDATTNFLICRSIHEKENALDNQHEDQEESKLDDATQTRETSTLRTDSQRAEGFIYVDKEKVPILSKLCDEENKMTIGNFNTLLSALMALDNESDKLIDFFHHSNSKHGKLVSIPSHTDQQKCLYKAHNKNNRWLDAILDQLAGEGADKEDAAQWIA